MTDCFFKGRMKGITCSGRGDLHHFVKQQRIRKRFPFGAVVVDDGTREPAQRLTNDQHYEVIPTDLILNDKRNMTGVCRTHHDNFHWSRFTFPFEDLPSEAIEFAGQYGLLPELERAYPRSAEAPQEAA